MMIMAIPLINLKRQYKSIKPEISRALKKVIDSQNFILGKEVESFEENFANLCKKKYCIGVSSGTSALKLALRSIGIKEGDEVITTSYTFIATVEAITSLGARPILLDIDEKTFNLDEKLIEKHINRNTRAIIPVHLFGHPCNMDEIISLAKKYKLQIIEDCAQSHLAEYKRKIVPISNIGCFSFFPSKNLGAYGDAGAVVTNSHIISDKIKTLRNHGRNKKKYIHEIEGDNCRMDEIQAAVLNVKLKHLKSWTNKRKTHVKMYNKLLVSPYISLPYESPYVSHVYHMYPIRIKNRNAIMKKLKEKNISSSVNYPYPLHLQRAYRYLSFSSGSFPVAEKLSKEILCLPICSEIKKTEIKHICKSILQLLI